MSKIYSISPLTVQNYPAFKAKNHTQPALKNKESKNITAIVIFSTLALTGAVTLAALAARNGKKLIPSKESLKSILNRSKNTKSAQKQTAFAGTASEELKAVKKAAKKAHRAAKKSERARIIEHTTSFVKLNNGKSYKCTIEHNKDNSFIKKYYLADKKIGIIETETFDKRISNIFDDNIKVTTINDYYGNMVTKMALKDKTGKYKLIRREIINTDDKTIKLIERLKNGNTQISTTTKLEKTVTIRDKKGKIISEQRYNIFNPEPAKTAKQETPEGWRQKYLKLCSQNGVKPRICGVKCGAWEHFLELKLKYENPTAYEKYLELRSYRARYDKIARIMQALDEKKIDASLLKPAKEDNSLQGIINFLNQIDSAKNRC